MNIIGINFMLITSLLIFFIGLSWLTVTRKNIFVTLMALELTLLFTDLNFLCGWLLLLLNGLFLMLYIMSIWWKNVIIKTTFEDQHKKIVRLGLRFGVLLLIKRNLLIFVLLILLVLIILSKRINIPSFTFILFDCSTILNSNKPNFGLFELICILFNTGIVDLPLFQFFLAFAVVTILIHCSLIAYNKKDNCVLFQFSVTSLCMLLVFLTLILYLREGFFAIKYFPFSFLSFFYNISAVIASLFCMCFLLYYITEYKMNSTEYYLLMLYAVLGLMTLRTANDFGTIFLALELQSLSLYMLSGFKKNSIYSIESGLKYFILGAFSAGYFLLGWSLLYGISGLFVLLGFHFFFNSFYDVTCEIEKNTRQCNIYDENQSDNHEFVENTLIPWNNLCFEVDNEFDEIGILSLFNNHFKVMLKLTEFFCCESSNPNSPNSDSNNKSTPTNQTNSSWLKNLNLSSFYRPTPVVSTSDFIGRSRFKELFGYVRDFAIEKFGEMQAFEEYKASGGRNKHTSSLPTHRYTFENDPGRCLGIADAQFRAIDDDQKKSENSSAVDWDAKKRKVDADKKRCIEAHDMWARGLDDKQFKLPNQKPYKKP